MEKYDAVKEPLISILLAVHDPQMEWLAQQLRSLNTQSYTNIKLFIRDDCSEQVHFSDIVSCVEKCITAFPVEIRRNAENMGSNRTFELLTQEAEGAYFAYCDQDDIWLPDKLVTLKKAFDEDRSVLLACSDMYIIDSNGNEIADSITKVRKRHVFFSGNNLAEGLLFHNFVTGCTMLIPSDIAKQSLPFCPYMVHDHYLALRCAAYGSIYSLTQPLVKVRFHFHNQTGVMAGVVDRESYQKIRIDMMQKRLVWLQKNVKFDDWLMQRIEEGIIWAKARQQHWKYGTDIKSIKTMIKYSGFSRSATMFEMIAVYMPKFVFLWMIGLIKRNIF